MSPISETKHHPEILRGVYTERSERAQDDNQSKAPSSRKRLSAVILALCQCAMPGQNPARIQQLDLRPLGSERAQDDRETLT